MKTFTKWKINPIIEIDLVVLHCYNIINITAIVYVEFPWTYQICRSFQFRIFILLFSGILPILGNIKLKDISGYLYHDRVPMYNFYFKQTLAVFTSNLSPNERKDEFILQFKPFSISSMTTRLKQFLLLMLFIILGITCLIKLNVFVRRIWKNQRKKYTYEA